MNDLVSAECFPDQLIHARGIIADVAHHADATALEALRILRAHGEPDEREKARLLQDLFQSDQPPVAVEASEARRIPGKPRAASGPRVEGHRPRNRLGSAGD